MSRPTAISPEEQEQIARRIGVLLLQAAPEDWQQITVEYRATGEYHDLLGEIASQDGSTQPWDPPEDLLGIFEHLREGMYQPDVGTWLSALYIVERPSSYRIDINFDSEPRWRRPLPRAAYVDELRRYPRDDKNIPDWMREKLDGSGAGQPASAPQAAESTPASATTGPNPVAPEIPPTPEPATSSAIVPPAMTSAAVSNGDTSTVSAASSGPEAQGPSSPSESAFAAMAPLDAGSEHTGLGIPDEPAAYAANGAETPAESGDFRIARLFDGFDEQGRPVVTTRPPVSPDEAGALRTYLENAKIVLSSQDYAEDLLDLERSTVVPTTWHTDGVWVWEGAVAYYLAQYGLPPEPDLVKHVRQRRFTLSEPDERTWNAAAGAVLNQLDSEDSLGPEDGLDSRDAVDSRDTFDSGSTANVSAFGDQSVVPDSDASSRGLDSNGFESAGFDSPGFESTSFDSTVDHSGAFGGADETSAWSDAGSGSQHERDPDGTDFETVLARLHDKFSEYGVDGESYRIGSHSTGARCLVQEGPDWVVTPGPDEPASTDLRFERADQAAAYLLGSLLMSASPRVDASEPEIPTSSAADSAPAISPPMTSPPTTSSPAAAAATPAASASPAETSYRETPSREAASGAAAQQESPDSEREFPAIGGLPRRSSSTPAQPAEQSGGGHFLFTANQEPSGPGGQGLSGQPPAAEPPVSQPTASQPAASQPTTSQPFAQEPLGQQPGTQQPGMQQPGTPGGQDPRRDSPQPQQQVAPNQAAQAQQQADQHTRTQQPGTQQPGQQQPTAQQAGQQPTVSQPSTQQYSANQPPLSQQSPQRDPQERNPEEQPTRYRALPSMDRPGPPPSPPSPPTGQPMGDPTSHGPGQNGQPQTGLNGSPGQQGPPPLPKRPPRGGQDSGPGSPGSGNPPQPGSNGAVSQAGSQAGPQAGPPPQGPVPGGRPPQSGVPGGQQAPGGQGNRPPQNNSGGNQPQGGQEQQIQPLRGEPPLTLYRDRQNVLLQPGTDVDRFGEPGGNVAYGARTPYSQRSLPPQWANRTYRAYRVQRPLQVLKGTAVPWFEQPGGGTAYVLPAAISDLVADGALVELSGAETPPRPAMD